MISYLPVGIAQDRIVLDSVHPYMAILSDICVMPRILILKICQYIPAVKIFACLDFKKN